MARYRTECPAGADASGSSGEPPDHETAPAAIVEIAPTRAKDRRVLFIVGRMQAHEWRGRASEEALAAEWGMPATTVKSLAQEAGRHLRLVGSPEMARDWCMAQLHRIIESTESEAAKLGAIKLVLEHTECRSWSQNEVAYTPTSAETVEMLVSELRNPGPELMQALQRAGWERIPLEERSP